MYSINSQEDIKLTYIMWWHFRLILFCFGKFDKILNNCVKRLSSTQLLGGKNADTDFVLKGKISLLGACSIFSLCKLIYNASNSEEHIKLT